MKRILLIFSVLLAAFSAPAVNYFTFADAVNDTLLINPNWIDSTRPFWVFAHFDGRVDQWTITMSYPEIDTLKVTSVIRGDDIDIPYFDSDGIERICHAPLTVSDNFINISSIITEFGYWDRYNNGNYESYGTVKWEAGDYYEMFKIYMWIKQDCTGDSITFDSSVYGTWDWRGGTTNGMFYNKVYLKVGYQRGDVNGDGLVNIGDVSALTNYLLTHQGLDQYQLEAADFNRDGNVTIADETALTNWLLMNGGLHSTDLDEIL